MLPNIDPISESLRMFPMNIVFMISLVRYVFISPSSRITLIISGSELLNPFNAFLNAVFMFLSFFGGNCFHLCSSYLFFGVLADFFVCFVCFVFCWVYFIFFAYVNFLEKVYIWLTLFCF